MVRKAYEERSTLLIWFEVAAWYDGLRSDPRFAGLVQDLGLHHRALLNKQ